MIHSNNYKRKSLFSMKLKIFSIRNKINRLQNIIKNSKISKLKPYSLTRSIRNLLILILWKKILKELYNLLNRIVFHLNQSFKKLLNNKIILVTSNLNASNLITMQTIINKILHQILSYNPLNLKKALNLPIIIIKNQRSLLVIMIVNPFLKNIIPITNPCHNPILEIKNFNNMKINSMKNIRK